MRRLMNEGAARVTHLVEDVAIMECLNKPANFDQNAETRAWGKVREI